MKHKILILLFLIFGLNTALFGENLDKKLSQKFQSTEILEKNCEKNESKSCEILAQIYIDQNITDKADFYIQKSCDLNSEYYCDKLIAKFLRNQDYDKAFIYAKKNYDLGEPTASHVLAKLYYNGFGVEKNVNLAMDYFKKSCNNNISQSCSILGNIYQNGSDDILKDENLSMKYFQKSCINGIYDDCVWSAQLYNLSKDYQKAVELVNIGCENKNFFSCAYLGIYYKKGLGVKQDNQKAKELFEIACNGGFNKACETLKKDYK
ncbi:sel1 repeat family protein [Campylobacter sp. JMF_04 NA10]|uniref:tetratricopeptide repeat protein n=1 Tax=Campylobacter sp. JMF_04 NA10 TaxID=2983824 RepID=UPI0022E9F18F|nr:tetratricopeptide repeat protein [Campylobacter sp. JMF_04 NA10]MDA3076550.1 sel1 repeat family protein [Campylobacter sp. JMF_04 NA10]